MTDILTPIPDPTHPRNRCRWHRVPRCLYWLCFGAGVFSAAFGGCHKKVMKKNRELISREFDFMFFRLLETSGGIWYFKAL